MRMAYTPGSRRGLAPYIMQYDGDRIIVVERETGEEVGEVGCEREARRMIYQLSDEAGEDE